MQLHKHYKNKYKNYKHNNKQLYKPTNTQRNNTTKQTQQLKNNIQTTKTIQIINKHKNNQTNYKTANTYKTIKQDKQTNYKNTTNKTQTANKLQQHYKNYEQVQ